MASHSPYSDTHHLQTKDVKRAENNQKRFIIFRALFNARFYYPVFTIIYLDFGLTLDQFAFLNTVWAVTIIAAEVPSGALSDLYGRKILLVATSSLMVLEMLVWALAPTGNPQLLFSLMLVNRVLSGLAEAAASGSDEALVYDSLEKAGMSHQWSKTLESAGQWQSVAFTIAMITGALVYDPDAVQSILRWFGYSGELDPSFTLRFPIYLTLMTSILCLLNCFGFQEPDQKPSSGEKLRMRTAFRQTIDTGKWILAAPFALLVILWGSFSDSVIRMFVTLSAEYYRIIGYPEFTLGFIGAGIALTHVLTARIGRELVERLSVVRVFSVISVLTMISYYGISLHLEYWGLTFAVLLFSAFFLVQYTLSYYLNRVSFASQRATVLSFKGMMSNFGYGTIGLAYAGLVQYIKHEENLPANSDPVFIKASNFFLPYYLVGLTAIVLIAWKMRNRIRMNHSMSDE